MAAIAALVVTSAVAATAQAPSHGQERSQDSRICGYRLMTERERAQYTERLLAARSEEDRARIRAEHREQMEARARERGFVLSCEKTRAPGALSDSSAPDVPAGLRSWTQAGGPLLNSPKPSSRNVE